jgi:hypothetical protein
MIAGGAVAAAKIITSLSRIFTVVSRDFVVKRSSVE